MCCTLNLVLSFLLCVFWAGGGEGDWGTENTCIAEQFLILSGLNI